MTPVKRVNKIQSSVRKKRKKGDRQGLGERWRGRWRRKGNGSSKKK